MIVIIVVIIIIIIIITLGVIPKNLKGHLRETGIPNRVRICKVCTSWNAHHIEEKVLKV